MVLNYIWVGFFLVAFVLALVKLIFQSDLEVFPALVQAIFDMAEVSVMGIALPLVGTMAFWLGIMKIGERGGAVNLLSRLISPLFTKIFPEIPKNHPAQGSMIMNFSANMLGLDNAATPLGLKAMEQLHELNPNKDTASNAQIMFLVLNTSGLTLIPVSVMALRAAAGAENPADIFIPILLATFFSSMAGLIVVSLFQKINLLKGVVLAYLGGVTLLISGFIYALIQMTSEQADAISKVVAGLILMGIIVAFILMAVRKKIDIFDAFIDGAKDGFQVAVKIIPFLVAMLVGIAVFKASGAWEFIMHGIRYIVYLFSEDARFVEALPTALMKPLSGSAARGMMVDAMNTHGADSFVGRLSATFQGTTETTFYVLAVYFGSVGISKMRYAVTAGLLADLAGIIAAIFIAYMFWG